MSSPIRKPPDHCLFTSSPKLIAGYHVLHRLLLPKASTICAYSLDYATLNDYYLVVIYQRRYNYRIPKYWRLYLNYQIFKEQVTSNFKLVKPHHHILETLNENFEHIKLWVQRTKKLVLPSRLWSQAESNRRPSACKADALPTELWPRNWWVWEDLNFRTSPLSGVCSTN